MIVPSLLGWHEHHGPCRDSSVAALEAGAVVPAPALIESYAVLTRLPAPHRLSPATAMDLLRGSFSGKAQIAALPSRSVWSMLAEIAASGVAGGRTHDAHVLAAALRASARVLLTVNVADFLPLAGERIEIRSPL